VVLAAGGARRFGGPKLTMPFGDSTVIGCVVRALGGAGLDPIIVVVGANRAEIEAALAGMSVCIVENPDPSREMLSSVQVGVAAAPPGVDRLVIALADQPRIRAEDVLRLLQHVGQEQAPAQQAIKGIALPKHAGKRGHPIVFDARYRGEILSLGPEATLRDVIHGHIDDVVEVEFASDAFVRDIDTQEQYEDERRRAETER
jgi:molybdenum cofactor cytidylyltransferase